MMSKYFTVKETKATLVVKETKATLVVKETTATLVVKETKATLVVKDDSIITCPPFCFRHSFDCHLLGLAILHEADSFPILPEVQHTTTRLAQMC
jgi:hypothetical protein